MAVEADDLAQLADAIDEAVRGASRPVLIQAARGLANEAGLMAAKAAVHDAPDLIRNAMSSVRDARQRERQVRDAYEDALADAEDDLARCFGTRSNKTYLVVTAAGEPIPEAEQKSYDAAERKAWLARELRRTNRVAFAEKALHNAELDVAMAVDDLSVAKDRFSAAKAELNGAVAYLSALSPALRSVEE